LRNNESQPKIYFNARDFPSKVIFYFLWIDYMNQDPTPPSPLQASAGKHFIRPDAHQVNPYESPMPKIGDFIGSNRIVRLIGEGGMANVYEVWHEGLEVTRALKILKNATDKELRERFLTEAKILADIHHPNVVEIHTIGTWDKNIPYLEMEYIDGLSIRELLNRHTRLPLSVAITIAYFVCQALYYAHTKDYTLYGKVYQGLIHRDIKPDNIIISKAGLVKLMDFGIARPTEVSLHTIGGKVMGSLAYLSPEQLEGKVIDHRSDIFSLGSVLYEMISGQRAYPQKTISELVRSKSKGDFARLDSFGLSLPSSLVSVASKAMALDLNVRFASAADFGLAMYAELRKLCDRPPSDILYFFSKDGTVPPSLVHAHSTVKQKKAAPWPVAFFIGGIGVIIASILGILKLTGVLP
jgi:eukaryotic-like serine/threonine-protein kinase